jgi:hypothetical protein
MELATYVADFIYKAFFDIKVNILKLFFKGELPLFVVCPSSL